ncbi:hypothetical protein DPMN_073145 [Dreissena polymorpha]|uniref:Uncharacterized protein n=1 Tax=Dreissena polymorpha TaxID=45954 RepID=A0A9D4HDH8_DREPO|nr:hypothetical protein DPMN_073145 [Dreissena polymorpha]
MKNPETILGAETCSELNLVQRINTINQKKSVPKDIEHKFPKIFEGLGCLSGKHHITVDPSVEHRYTFLGGLASPEIFKCRNSPTSSTEN